MAGYFRPSIQKDTEQEFNEFLEEHPELPLRDAKELMLFATRKFIVEVEHDESIENISSEKLNKYAESLISD